MTMLKVEASRHNTLYTQIHTKCLYINYLVTIYLEDVQQTTYELFALANLEGINTSDFHILIQLTM